MKRLIVTYEVPVIKLETGNLEIKDKEKVAIGLPEEVEILKAGDVNKIAIDLGQENSNQIEIARQLVDLGKSSTIKLRYLQ